MFVSEAEWGQKVNRMAREKQQKAREIVELGEIHILFSKE